MKNKITRMTRITTITAPTPIPIHVPVSNRDKMKRYIVQCYVVSYKPVKTAWYTEILTNHTIPYQTKP